MHYLFSRYIHFSTTYHLSVYDITYETLGHTHPVIFTVTDNAEYIPTKTDMELESNSLLTPSSIHPEKSMETHEIFHTGK